MGNAARLFSAITATLIAKTALNQSVDLEEALWAFRMDFINSWTRTFGLKLNRSLNEGMEG